MSRYGDESGSCKGSSHPGQPSGSCPCTPPPTTSSLSLVTSSPLVRTGSSELGQSRRGATRPESEPEAAHVKLLAATFDKLTKPHDLFGWLRGRSGFLLHLRS